LRFLKRGLITGNKFLKDDLFSEYGKDFTAATNGNSAKLT